MTDLPAPLVPPECTMGNNDYFPLYFRRLRKSRWWRSASDLARSRNIDLWGEAYEQQPAGSLPDDDIDLAEASGYGRDVRSFQKAKAEILAPWVLCSDGRWYHPTLCEVVLFLWESGSVKRKSDAKRAKDYRERVRAGRVTPKESTVTRDGGLEGVTENTRSRVTGPETPVTRHAKERRGNIGSEEPVASAAPDAPVSLPSDDEAFEALWAACTPEMRRRAKSKAKVKPEWRKACKLAEPRVILGGCLGYLAADPDVKRTGGPGLHIWLRDRTWELWTDGEADPARTWSDGEWTAAVEIWRGDRRWSAAMGPEPGAPGCRVPSHLLITHASQAEVA